MSSFSMRRLGAVALVAASVLLLTAAPAAAHDDLIESTPAAGERLSDAPATVSLAFSADVLTLGAIIIVADGAGRDWVEGDLDVQANVVSVAVAEGMPDAGYELRWRVVSSDGHPISGIVPFTVGDGEPLERTPSPSSEAPPAGDAESQITQEPGVPRALLIGGVGAAAAAAGFAAVLFIRRRRRADGTDASSD